MLYLIALHVPNEIAPLRLTAPDTRGSLIRVGGKRDDDLVLPDTVTIDAEIFSDGERWHVRHPDGSIGPARTGLAMDFGHWIVYVLVSEAATGDGQVDERTRVADAISLLSTEDDLARFIPDDAAPVVLAASTPMVFGSAVWCDLRVPDLPSPAAAIIWRPRERDKANMVPCLGVSIAIDGRQVRTPIELWDGCRIAIDDSPHAITYSDPQEELDRLLGLIREPNTDSAPPSEATPEPHTTNSVFGRTSLAAAKDWLWPPTEVAFAASALAILSAFGFVFWLRY